MIRIICVLMLLIASCSNRANIKPTEAIEIKQSWIELQKQCEIKDDLVECPASVFSQGLIESVDTWEAYKLCKVDLTECSEIAGIDKQECNWLVNKFKAESIKYKGHRWTFGAVGLVLGAALVVGFSAL